MFFLKILSAQIRLYNRYGSLMQREEKAIKYPEDAEDFEYSGTLNTLSTTENFTSIPGGMASPIKFNGSVLGTIIGFHNGPGTKIEALVLFAGKDGVSIY